MNCSLQKFSLLRTVLLIARLLWRVECSGVAQKLPAASVTAIRV
uniref:Uncharacterized protein n=1 Tax=Arundo donax TaxID=35708 RepID=A0A0A9AYW2_ARUDO